MKFLKCLTKTVLLIVALLFMISFSTMAKIDENSVRYLNDCFEDFYLYENVIYGEAINYNGDTEQLKLDAYLPQDDNTKNRPAILLIHGGGLIQGDKSTDFMTRRLATDLSKIGYVVFNVNYRLAQRVSPLALRNAIADVATAFNWIRNNSEKYGVDKNHLAVLGYSAGAVIAVNLCYSNDSRYQMEDSAIFSVVSLSGNVLYFGEAIATNPPCLIIHGTADQTAPYNDSLVLERTLKAAGVRTMLYPLEGVKHALTLEYDRIRDRVVEFLYSELTAPKNSSIEPNN